MRRCRRRRCCRCPGLTRAQLGHRQLAAGDEAAGGVDDAPGQPGSSERLGLDEDAAQLAGRKSALRLQRREATLAACRLRLRPIIMTSFAFILGVVPLMVSHGAGAEMRRTLGTAVFAGMLGVTAFGIFLTPVFFYVIQWYKDRHDDMLPEAKEP